MSPPWTLGRGAQLEPNNSVRFTVWAPRVREPRVRICTGPAQGDHALAPIDAHSGLFTAVVPNAGANADYVFVVGDGRLLPDPVSRWQPNGVHAASRVVDPSAHRWTDAGWRGVALTALVVYELHIGT